MKLLLHLLVSASALVAMTATPVSCRAVGVSYLGRSEDASKLLRGPERNYDAAEIYPGPQESDGEREMVTAAEDEYKSGPIVDAGEDDDRELVLTAFEIDDHKVVFFDGDDVGDNIQAVTTYEDDTLGYGRKLRSLVDPAPLGQIQLAMPTPPGENVMPPSSPDSVLSDAVPNLRGPEDTGKL